VVTSPPTFAHTDEVFNASTHIPVRKYMFQWGGRFAIRCDDKRTLDFIEDYLWPYVSPDASPEAVEFELAVLNGVIARSFFSAFTWEPLVLRRPTTRPWPDRVNVGLHFASIPEIDRIVVNPITLSQFLVVGTTVIALNPDPSVVLWELNLVLHHLLTLTVERRGAMTIHGSGVMLSGKGILFVGAGGAGKTTMAMSALEGDATFITNEIAALWGSAGGFRLGGFPGPLKLVNIETGGKDRITLRQYFCDSVTAVETSPVPLTAVVFPEVRSSHAVVTLTELDSAVGHALLASQTYTPCDVTRPKWLGLDAKSAHRVERTTFGCRFFRLTCPHSMASAAITTLKAELLQPVRRVKRD
jgi:hypothetical protein